MTATSTLLVRDSSRPKAAGARGAQRGALMIEVLVAILISAFGLLGFFGLQVQSATSMFESYQRSQALVLVGDMVERMNANRANAGDYSSDILIGAGPLVDCTGMTGAPLDLCEWGNLIRGSSEIRGGVNVGAMLSARGCITRVAGTSDLHLVSVVWTGLTSTGAPPSACGEGDPSFPDDTLRRAVSTTLCVGLLRDAATAPVVARC